MKSKLDIEIIEVITTLEHLLQNLVLYKTELIYTPKIVDLINDSVYRKNFELSLKDIIIAADNMQKKLSTYDKKDSA